MKMHALVTQSMQAVALLCGFLQLQSIHAQDTWSGFQNGGRFTVSNLPETWDPQSKNVAWKVDIQGYGQSTPVVFGDQVFVTSTSGKNKDEYHLVAYALADGSKRWQHDFKNPSPEESNNYVSRAAPSPVVDTQGLIVSFEGGVVASFSHDGKLRWSKNLVEQYGPIKARHGLASSLEQDKQNVYVWVEREQDPYLLALSKTTGDVVWKSPGVGATSWSSPRLLDVAGKPQLLCSSSGKIAGYDAATGNKLWEFSSLANNTTCTPIPVSEGRFLIGASDGRGEQSGTQTAASSGLIEVKALSDGKYSVDFVWRAEKATCSFGSPIAAGDRVWMVNRAGVLYQLDLETGKQLSAERVSCGSVWATPLATSEKLYLFGQKGITSIVELATAKEHSTCSTWEESNTAPPAAMGGSVLYAAAWANDTLLIRRGDCLYAIRK